MNIGQNCLGLLNHQRESYYTILCSNFSHLGPPQLAVFMQQMLAVSIEAPS